MGSFGGSVALRAPVCGDLFGLKVRERSHIMLVSRDMVILIWLCAFARINLLATVGGFNVRVSAQRGGTC